MEMRPNTTPNMMEIPPKLKEYIDNNRGSLPPITDPDEPLQIDSLGLIRMVAFLENDLGYRVEDEELIAENFVTMRALGELLETKTPEYPRAAASAGANRADGFSDVAFCQAGSKPDFLTERSFLRRTHSQLRLSALAKLDKAGLRTIQRATPLCPRAPRLR